MRLNKEDYRKAEGCLRRYNYNCINIMNIREDIISIGVPSYDGLPKAPYSVSDSVFNQYIQLQENKALNESLQEIKAVRQALALVSLECNEIFNEYYLKQRGKWETIETLGLSERTFLRRKKDLIYTVEKELKKVGIKLA